MVQLVGNLEIGIMELSLVFLNLLVLLYSLLFYINILSYLVVLSCYMSQPCDCNQLHSPFPLKQMYLVSFIIYIVCCLLFIILSKLHYFMY